MAAVQSQTTNSSNILTSRLWALSFAIIVLLIDCISKAFVHQTLPVMNASTSHYPYGGIPLFQNFLGIEFSLSHAINHGAAWGIFSQYQSLLLGIRIALVCLIFANFWHSDKHPFWRIPLALILAGAFGNILDSFIYGHVIDMFHFVFWGYDYPVFNVADSAIFIGIASLIICSWYE